MKAFSALRNWPILLAALGLLIAGLALACSPADADPVTPTPTASPEGDSATPAPTSPPDIAPVTATPTAVTGQATEPPVAPDFRSVLSQSCHARFNSDYDLMLRIELEDGSTKVHTRQYSGMGFSEILVSRTANGTLLAKGEAVLKDRTYFVRASLSAEAPEDISPWGILVTNQDLPAPSGCAATMQREDATVEINPDDGLTRLSWLEPSSSLYERERTEWEMWVDSDGQPVRSLITAYRVPDVRGPVVDEDEETQREPILAYTQEETYSNFGEPNVIVAPEVGSMTSLADSADESATGQNQPSSKPDPALMRLLWEETRAQGERITWELWVDEDGRPVSGLVTVYQVPYEDPAAGAATPEPAVSYTVTETYSEAEEPYEIVAPIAPPTPEPDAVVISVADASAVSEGEVLEFRVTLSTDEYSGDILVNVDARAGTATEGQDYTRYSNTLRFTNFTAEKIVRVRTYTDYDDEEGPETVQLVLSSPIDGVLGNHTATGTIKDVPLED